MLIGLPVKCSLVEHACNPANLWSDLFQASQLMNVGNTPKHYRTNNTDDIGGVKRPLS